VIDAGAALQDYAALVTARSDRLCLVVLAGYVLGGFLIGEPVRRVQGFLYGWVEKIGKRLDRSHRSIATRVYRGIIALSVLLMVSILAAAALMHTQWPAQLLVVLLAVLWFGAAFSLPPLVSLWQRARQGTLGVVDGTTVYNDTHGLIRYRLERQMDALASQVVGVCFWFLLAGILGALLYITTTSAAHAYRHSVFGWAARALHRVLDAVPRVLTRLMMVVAACFVTGCHPLHALIARDWRSAVARLYGVALGGTTPQGERPWVGDGSARLHATHLRQLLTLQLAMLVLLGLILQSHNVINLLNNIDI
jgi:cobalamin biosynthesis protein CobD/CbiB